jgi:hypothetical protein
MIIGDKLYAPDGFRNLKNSTSYHFLSSNAVTNRVRLVWFSESQYEVSAVVETLSRDEFENALEDGSIKPDVNMDNFPFWLETIKGINHDFLENNRSNPLESYSAKITRRFNMISELLEQESLILNADDPDRIINAYVKTLTPKQSAKRVRAWFYIYIIFGRNRWALLPRFHKIGRWERERVAKSQKLGRHSKYGRGSGYSVDAEMKMLMVDGFVSHKKEKVWWKIYNKVLVSSFECRVVKNIDCRAEFYQPEGKPYPTFNQFIYWVKKLTAPEKLAVELKGRNHARSQSGSTGSFAEMLTNLNQKVEFDGFYFVEKLSGINEGSSVDGFCVVRATCVLSGAIVGVGFAKGRESEEAYRMALFSMAIDKTKYGELFGIDIEEHEWPCRGLPANVIFDRGPAAGFDVGKEVRWLGALELTPTNSGQSKATVESSHPRKPRRSEMPSYFHSSHDFVRMSKRQIYQVLVDNQTSDASSRMTDDMLRARFTATPNNIWLYLDSRARNSGYSIPFEEAVRRFLTEYPVSIERDGVYFFKRKFSSPEFAATGAYDKAARGGQIKIKAYAMTMCVRHIWAEYKGKLYELFYHANVSVPEGTADISLYDLIELAELSKETRALGQDEQLAIQQYYRQRFLDNTSSEWDAGAQKSGKPKKDGASQRDNADYKRLTGR